jgi:hypothetical protein
MLNNNINYNAAPVPMATTVPVQGMPQPYAPQPTPYPQGMPSYAPDQASFSPYGAAPRPQQPAVQVGLMDKMKSYFNDTYNTEDNLRAYKIFQQEVDNNPQTLKPGSQDKGRVEELQRRLNIVGISANVNGIYGYATGEAIKEFKTKMGINDGFLNKEGKPAITDIATPQMQAVLNYAVTRQLNPGMPGPNNPMPLTQEDMVWAQNLMARVQQFGYKPTQQEYSRYQDILARQQTSGTPQMPQTQVPANPIVMQPPVQQPVFQPPAQTSLPLASGPVNQQELQWALDLQTRITNQGYQPSAQEAAQYDNIQKRYAAQQAPASQPTAPANSGQPVTQQELDWALDLQNRITTQGYQPTQQEADAYTDIFNRYQNQPAQPTAPSAPTRPAPGTTAPVRIDNSVSSQELQWAMDLQHRIDTQGYRPTQQDIIRYTDIYNRYQASQQEAANKPPVVAPQPSQPSAPPVVTQPSQPAPTQPAAPQPSPGGNSTHPNAVAYQDVQWARQLEGRMVDGHRATEAEVNRYNDIQMRISMFGIQAAPAAPVAPTQQSAGVTQSEVDWAMQLQHKVQFQGYAPSEQEVAAYTDIYSRYQQQAAAEQTAAAQQPAAPQPTAPAPQQPVTVQVNVGGPQGAVNPPTQQELDWAMRLQTMIQQQGYQASDHEMQVYTDIYNRAQGGQGVSAQQQPTAPQQPMAPQYTAPVAPPQPAYQAPPGNVMIDVGAADNELQWALELLNRYRQGYQPSQSELTMYEQIISRKAVPGATP